MTHRLLLPLLLAIGLAATGCCDKKPAPEPETPTQAGASTVETAKPAAGTPLTLAERFPPGKNCTIEAVRAAVRPHLSEIRSCYQQALLRDATVGGELKLQIVISEQGQASRVLPLESDFKDKRASSCIIDVLETIPYAPSPRGKPCTVVYPFDLQVSDEVRSQLQQMKK